MMRAIQRWMWACALLALALGVQAREVPLEDFFKDPEFSNVTLSPTGEYISVSVPQEDRTVLAVFRVSDMKLQGKWDQGANQHVDRVVWVNPQRFFMYVSQKLGRYDFRVGTPDVIASNVDGSRRVVIPNGGTYGIVDTLDGDDDSVLVQRSVDSAYLFRMNVYSGDTRTVATAPLRFGYFIVDGSSALRYVVGQESNNETVTLRRDGERWTEVHRAAQGEGTWMPYGFAEDNSHVYVGVSEAGKPQQVRLLDPESGEMTDVIANQNVDPSGLLMSASGRTPLGVYFDDGLPVLSYLDRGSNAVRLYAGLEAAFPDRAVRFRGASRDGRYVLINAYSDVDPGSFYLFDSQTGQAKFLLASREWIKPAEMAEMRAVQYTARDGKTIHGYLTLPKGSEGRLVPLVLHPHGGPHGPRDVWGFNPDVQFLANRGYAVLQVNFRGSGGYGDDFERAGYRNWGTSMIDDMTDGVRWAVAQGHADGERVCTYGASYGGYAALQSVVREPALYKCAIGYVGVYSLPLMKRDGDIPKSESGRAYLQRVLPEAIGEQRAQSPADQAASIRVPVMLVHGGRDQRVPMSQFRALKSALEAAGNPPEREIVAPREGHGFYELDNQKNLYTQLEAFLDAHIGPSSATQN